MESPGHNGSLSSSDEEDTYCTPNQSQETEAAKMDATPDFKSMAPENSATVTAIETSPQTRSKDEPSKAHRHEVTAKQTTDNKKRGPPVAGSTVYNRAQGTLNWATVKTYVPSLSKKSRTVAAASLWQPLTHSTLNEVKSDLTTRHVIQSLKDQLHRDNYPISGETLYVKLLHLIRTKKTIPSYVHSLSRMWKDEGRLMKIVTAEAAKLNKVNNVVDDSLKIATQ